MKCPEIKELKFSLRSKQAITEIKRKKELANVLTGALGAATVFNIFASHGALKSSYDIYGADWKLFSQAMSSIPEILRKEIWKIAGEAALDHPFGSEHKFWEAVADGCDN